MNTLAYYETPYGSSAPCPDCPKKVSEQRHLVVNLGFNFKKC